MDDRVMQFRVGVMVLATLIISAILIMYFEKMPIKSLLFQETYTIKVKFDEIRDITKGTSVYKNGIRIGEVEKVELADDDKAVLVTAEIEEGRQIYQNEECYVSSKFMGDTSLSFRRSKDPDAPKELIDRTITLQGQDTVSEDPTGMKAAMEAALKGPFDTVKETGDALKVAGDKLADAADKLSGFLDQNSGKMAETLDSMGKAAKNANDLFGDPETQAQLKVALRNLPDTLDQFRLTMKKAQTNLDNLEEFTGALRVDGKKSVRDIHDLIAQAKGFMTELNMIVQAINDEESSLGLLIKDPQLYNDLAAAAKNVNEASRRLRPIVEDVRVFTDKIARHPGLIVRDAVRPGAGLK